MNKELINLIDEKIEEATKDIIKDTVKLVNINSERGDAIPGAPFGKGAREVLDTVLEMGKEEGFAVKDYNVGVVSAAFTEGEADLGIWAHGDVVPAGEGWDYEPYNATVIDDKYIIGRGVTDNKGQLAAIFNLLKIFKKLDIKLNYNPALFVGSAEETGMHDLKGMEGNDDAKGFINVCTPPRLSLVPDGGFPIGYGARGAATFYIKSKTPLHGFTFTAGKKETPGIAEAVFDNTCFDCELKDCNIIKGEKTKVSAFSEPMHSASADGKGNMITILSSALIESGKISDEDLYILEFFKKLTTDVKGEMLGIDVESKLMGKCVVAALSVTCEDGYPEMTLRIRFPIELTFEKMLEKITENCDKQGFTVRGERRHDPYLYDNTSEVFKKLSDIANEVTGENGVPYINGSTYAHYLPNAYIYGMSGNVAPPQVKSGRGGAHGIDESVSLDRLKRAMRIYARALLMLNETKW